MSVALSKNLVSHLLNTTNPHLFPTFLSPYPLENTPKLVEVRRKGLRARFLGLEIRRNVVKNEKIL